MSNAVGQLDTERLGAYLEQHIEGFKGPLSAEKFAGGQSNPTFLLTATSGKYVLRRKPPGELLQSAHAVDREFKVIAALADTPVPVARAYHLCEDNDVIGSMFYVMSFEEGRILWDPALPEVDLSLRKEYQMELIRVMAAMHDVDLEKVGLSDYGRPGNYFERQIGRWTKQYRASETETIDAMEKLLEWLPENIPADDGQVSLIHGDYRLDNVMFDPTEPKAIAVLDWELSTLGHPFADLSYYCMGLRMPPQNNIRGIAGLDRKAHGIMTEEEIVEEYCKLRNIGKIDNWHFYIAFSFFRLSAICQGVYKRAIDGNASSTKAVETGKMAKPLAVLGAELIN